MKMPTRNPATFILLIIVAIAVLALSIWAGSSPLGWLFPSANAQTVPPALVRLPKPITLQDRDTYTMALDQTHQLCWQDANNPPATKIRIYRYRVEGGARTLYLDLLRAGWVSDPIFPTSFCKSGISIPKAGHWIYDAELCWDANCSVVVTASCATGTTGCAGTVGSVARGWWIYAFLPPPPDVGVN